MTRALCACLRALALAAMLVPAVPARAESVTVRAGRVVMSYENPDIDRIDALTFRGGLDLRSPDRRFGGLSGLDISPDGDRLVAVGDRGIWFTARLVYDEDGRLTGVDDTEIRPLLGVDGAPLAGNAESDAESLARLTDGSLVVAFEHDHRLLRYETVGARPTRFPAPVVLQTSPANQGAEAVTRLWGNALLILAEGLDARPGVVAGWIGARREWRAVGFAKQGIYRPVGAATRDDGAVFVLERRFTTLGGIGTRIALVEPGAIQPGKIFEGRELAQLVPPLVADNFEGIDVRRGKGRETLIYIVSDDNFSALQRTYLLLFALAD